MRQPNPVLRDSPLNLTLHVDDALQVRRDPKPAEGARCLCSQALPAAVPAPVDSPHFRAQDQMLS